MSIDRAGKAVSRARKSVNPSPWILKRVIRRARRPAEARQVSLRRLNALAATWAPCSHWRSHFFAGGRASGREQSRPERAADDRVDGRSHRQEEADRDAGEAGQD